MKLNIAALLDDYRTTVIAKVLAETTRYVSEDTREYCRDLEHERYLNLIAAVEAALPDERTEHD